MSETPNHAPATAILRLFERAREGRLSAGDLKKKLTSSSKTSPVRGLDGDAADLALAGLIDDGLLATSGGSKQGHHPRPNASYRLTEKGKHHLRPSAR